MAHIEWYDLERDEWDDGLMKPGVEAVERIVVIDKHIFLGDNDGIIYSYAREPDGDIKALNWRYSGSIWGLSLCGKNLILGWSGDEPNTSSFAGTIPPGTAALLVDLSSQKIVKTFPLPPSLSMKEPYAESQTCWGDVIVAHIRDLGANSDEETVYYGIWSIWGAFSPILVKNTGNEWDTGMPLIMDSYLVNYDRLQPIPSLHPEISFSLDREESLAWHSESGHYFSVITRPDVKITSWAVEGDQTPKRQETYSLPKGASIIPAPNIISSCVVQLEKQFYLIDLEAFLQL